MSEGQRIFTPMKTVYSLCLSLLFMGCHFGRPSSPPAVAAEHVDPTQEQTDRRKRSEAICAAHNVPIYKDPHAMFTDPEDSVTLRPKDTVADRALALRYIAIKGDGADSEVLDAMYNAFTIGAKLSPGEVAYARAEHPTKQQDANAFWRYESLNVLLWALGYVDSLPYPAKACNPGALLHTMDGLNETQFREKTRLRSKKEILDQVDLILRLHWACVQNRLDKKDVPGGLDEDVVMERHYALNWLINYMDEAWDDVTTDT